MGGRKARGPAPSSAALAPNECPNCGGALAFEPTLPEGFCPTCGIYVELAGSVRPVPDAKPLPPLDPELIKGALKRDLERLSRSHGLRNSGKKSELAARLLRYQELKDLAAGNQPDSPSERAIARRGLLLFLLSLGISRHAAEALASLFGSLRTFQGAAADDIDLLAGVSLTEALRLQEAIAQGETVPPPEHLTAPEQVSSPEEAFPPESPSETRDDEPSLAPQPEEIPPAQSSETAELPLEPSLEITSSESVSAPELFLASEGDSELVLEETPQAVSSSGDLTSPPDMTARLRRDRWILYGGIALQAIGGFGLIFGSLLHDVFRVPWFGQNFATFGTINAAFAVGGVMLLMAGLGAIGFSLRGGVVRSPPAAEG